MIEQLDDLFFTSTETNKNKVISTISDALGQMDDGELFMEYNQSEVFSFDDGVLKNANYNTNYGFGLRSVLGEATAYAHSSEISHKAIKSAADAVKAIKHGNCAKANLAESPTIATNRLYSNINPLDEIPFARKTKLLQEIDSYLRKKEPLVKQVSTSLSGEWQAVQIIRCDGQSIYDIRPLVRLNISVVVEKNGRMERGSFGTGGRQSYEKYIETSAWKKNADEALRQALVNLESIPAPAGQMQVILGNGWPGILLHEAIGHGLEGDFNRKKTSAFSELMGKRVATKGVTVIDDGTIADRRGSITVDDEGTPSQKTVLIEDGILTGYMNDRLNGRLMGSGSTGNGRRESYASQPIPRMTNTYMLSGNNDPEDIIKSVKNGIYAVSFGGGQVDITSGKFVFSASEAYMVEDGKITAPVKGATLVGNGPDVLTKIKMIGNDMALDPGIGTCGKAGQGVPVGVGQPTMLIEGLTVGGTEAG
ncbi:metalloprotease TldD [Rickettsiales bacterium]|nr:metalloprotease TldD [Rickettsiales bacterium]